ncbi:MAG TPA: hypothetical protein VEK79_02115 [Thermoanaerobaculia bacterium]|nr:hypothetical protein [Thermoanaerobaculia bacterium]
MRVAAAFLCVLSIAAASLAQDPPPKLDPAAFDRYLGYEFPSGRLIVIARTERRLYAYASGSEMPRGLERVDDRTWTAGPSLLVFQPETYRLTFVANDRGDITSLRYHVADAKPIVATKSRSSMCCGADPASKRASTTRPCASRGKMRC